MTTITVRIPWPKSSIYSQNARGHWATKAKRAKEAKTHGHWLALDAMREAGISRAAPIGTAITAVIKLAPPDNRRRDRDNVIASLKSFQDGIAAAIGVDDSQWTPTYVEIEPETKGGYVEFVLTPIGTANARAA